jgi:hypothetical protein
VEVAWLSLYPREWKACRRDPRDRAFQAATGTRDHEHQRRLRRGCAALPSLHAPSYPTIHTPSFTLSTEGSRAN